MFELIIGIGIIIFVAIIFTILRIVRLVNVARGTDKKVVSSGNKVNGLLMLLFLLIFGGLMTWYSVVEFETYTIPIASDHGIVTDRLFWITMIVTGIVFIITHILLFYFAYRYQYSEKKRALFYPDNSKLEVVWTVIPAIVLSILVFSGWKAWTEITSKAPENAEVVEILGYQFGWEFRYPGQDKLLGDTDYRLTDPVNSFGVDFTDRSAFDDFQTTNKLVIPKGQPILFKIRARDVLHSVFIPEFRLKQDAVPGMPTRFWFVANKTTAEMREQLEDPEFNYYIFCTEICGRGHFSMRKLVEVVEPEEYAQWYASQEPWLQKNPDYLAKVPNDMKELAMITAGIENIQIK
ncbi:MAG: cytochrome c oxidase subunit II [Cyclobacteriaceae bacterium]